MTTSSLVEALEAEFRRCCDLDVSLQERLERFAESVRKLSPPFADAVDRLVSRLQQSCAGAGAPRAGDPMPAFALPDDGGNMVSLADLVNKGPVAVTFHRGHWCPYCRINTKALAQAQKQVEATGSTIVAIMPDRQQFAAEFKSESQAQFPVLTDMDNGYALSLNLAIWVGEEMERIIAGAGFDIPAYQGNASWMLPIPATFVVGMDGCVKSRFVDPDYRKRMAIEDLIAALKNAN